MDACLSGTYVPYLVHLYRNGVMTTFNTTPPRGSARREALVEAVLQLVAEIGVDAVTHRRVAEAAGLPLASTTYWFSSKEQMLVAALELAADRDIAQLHEFVERGVGGPAAVALGAVLQSAQAPTEDGTGSLLAGYALAFEAARRPVLRAIVRRWTEEYVSTIARLLEAAGSTDPTGDAELLLAAADGLMIGQLSSGTGKDLGPGLERLITALTSTR